MNPEVKQKWIKALKSGKYQQGNAKLCQRIKKNDNPEQYTYGYCCLGVLTELFLEEFPGKLSEEWVNNTILNSKPGTIAYDQSKRYILNDVYMSDTEATYLPYSVQKWADLERNPRVNISDISEFNLVGYLGMSSTITLASLNDSNVPFETIADIIKKTL